MGKSGKIIAIILVIVLLGVGIYFGIKNKKESEKKIENLENKITGLETKNENVQSNTNNITNNSDSKIKNNINNVKNNTTKEKNTVSNNQKSNKTTNNNLNSSDENKVSSEEKELYYYCSGDTEAANGNPTLLHVYEANDNIIKFKYHNKWSSDDITGIANKKEKNLFVYESKNEKIEFLLNSMGENSVQVTEYEDGNLSSEINLFK